jgi:hypothetical protein
MSQQFADRSTLPDSTKDSNKISTIPHIPQTI